MKVDFANLQRQYQRYKREIDDAIGGVLERSDYILGQDVRDLESELQHFTGAAHAISCASGTDALQLALMAQEIDIDDEVITTPFTFIATAETIALLMAKPVFVDIDPVTFNIDVAQIEAAITDRTRAIMPVSLYGQPANMDAISAIAHKHGLSVIVDGAQSFGSTYKNMSDSALGHISITSFFPAKPLGCFGDGGAVFTQNPILAAQIKCLRAHGQSERYQHSHIGLCARMDTLQAAILRVKLRHYAQDISKRQRVAQHYSDNLQHLEYIQTPTIAEDRTSVWAQYTIRCADRSALQQHLQSQGIPFAVHYPKPLHLQECFAYLGYSKGDFPESERAANEVLSLPMNPDLSDQELEYITGIIKKLPIRSA